MLRSKYTAQDTILPPVMKMAQVKNLRHEGLFKNLTSLLLFILNLRELASMRQFW